MNPNNDQNLDLGSPIYPIVSHQIDDDPSFPALTNVSTPSTVIYDLEMKQELPTTADGTIVLSSGSESHLASQQTSKRWFERFFVVPTVIIRTIAWCDGWTRTIPNWNTSSPLSSIAQTFRGTRKRIWKNCSKEVEKILFSTIYIVLIWEMFVFDC